MHFLIAGLLFYISWADTLCIPEEYQPKGNLRSAIGILPCTKNQDAAVLMLFITL